MTQDSEQNYKSVLGASAAGAYVLAYPAILLLRTNLGERANRYTTLYFTAALIGVVVLVAHFVFKSSDRLDFEIGFENTVGIKILCVIIAGAWLANTINIYRRDRNGAPLYSHSSGESWPMYAPIYQWMARHKIRFDIVQIFIEPALLGALGVFLIYGAPLPLPYIATFLLMTSVALHSHGVLMHALNREAILDEQDMRIIADARGMGKTKEPEIQAFVARSAVPNNLEQENMQ